MFNDEGTMTDDAAATPMEPAIPATDMPAEGGEAASEEHAA